MGGACSQIDRGLEPLLCCWPDLLLGRACVLYNCLFAPLVLCFHAIRIYLCGCLSVVFKRWILRCCCCVCRWGKCCWLFTDKAFPPSPESLGRVSGDAARGPGLRTGGGEVVWLRAGTFAKSDKETMQLFAERVEAGDICQGALGDCWLLAAMACLAEHEGAVQSLFLSKEYDPRGKYKIRLFDGAADQWETLVVDDFIPCDPRLHQQGCARPIFSQPHGNELWAILLEKAFAKFCGSYAGLEGGTTVWALRAMTGDHAKVFSRKWVADGMGAPARAEYSRADLQNIPDDADRRKSRYLSHAEKKSGDDMFNTLRTYHRLGSVLCASGASGIQGLRRSHAYSILAVYASPKGHRLVKIRNPWGSGEWSGAWSDRHENWTRYPEVAKAVKHEARDDGVFWMSWEDFMLHWEEIGVVDRTVDISTLRYSVASGAVFPATRGFIRGCLRFWCRCWGCRRLYCPHRSSQETASQKQGCLSYKHNFIAV